MTDLLVFAVIGALLGAAARLWYPGRGPLRVFGTMLVGMAGSVPAGLFAWAVWPAGDGQPYTGALLTSFLGAVVVLEAWAWVAYGRRVSGRR